MTLVERIQATGIRRLGDKENGFRYERGGGAAPGPADLARIEALKIPPAWRDARNLPRLLHRPFGAPQLRKR